MKTLINDNNGFRTYLYFTDATHPIGCKHIKITTQWLDAKNPDNEQIKFQMILDQTSMNNLIQALTQ